MTGVWGAHAQTFVMAYGAVAGIAFALPLLFAPLAWARAFRWQLPQDTDLTVYFGRCLGVVAVALTGFLLFAGVTGRGVEQIIQISIVVAIGMTAVHIWGAIRRTQPVTETIEIAFWGALILLGFAFLPA
jgi:hypothetical protein